MEIHVHFNNKVVGKVEQTCKLKGNLEIGQTATVHLHDVPESCQTCPNGHCHAPNLSITRVTADKVFIAFEDVCLPAECDIKTLPPHQIEDH